MATVYLERGRAATLSVVENWLDDVRGLLGPWAPRRVHRGGDPDRGGTAMMAGLPLITVARTPFPDHL
jgi:hypothetical protein